MTAVQFVAVGFLTISVVSFLAQTAALVKVLEKRVPPPRRAGLVRTVSCRVAAAGVYVGLGVASLFVSSGVAAIVGFVVYSLTQVMWLMNSYADLRLARSSVSVTTAKHRSQGRDLADR